MFEETLPSRPLAKSHRKEGFHACIERHGKTWVVTPEPRASPSASASKKSVRNETVAPSVRLPVMQLDTEVDVPHDGTVLEFCEMTNRSVSSGRALALVENC